MVETCLEGLKLVAFGLTTEPVTQAQLPAFGLVAQGRKRIALGNRVFECGPGQYVAGSLPVPITSQVTKATAEEPFLALSWKLRPSIIAEFLVDAGVLAHGPFVGMGVGGASRDLLELVVRLLRLLDRPRDRQVLAPLLERELVWHLLCGEQGGVVRQVAIMDVHLSQISRAIQWIRTHFAEPLRIEELAEQAAMSVSTFYRHFRVTTAMTPIQYQKQVRMQEARLRLISESVVAEVGFAVGYDSPSQFNREYRRFYGLPPGQDAVRLQNQPVRERMVFVEV
jgi:AraC-like DNA-binding protein